MNQFIVLSVICICGILAYKLIVGAFKLIVLLALVAVAAGLLFPGAMPEWFVHMLAPVRSLVDAISAVVARRLSQ